MARPLLDAVLGVLIPPVQFYRKKNICRNFWIDLVLYILLLFIPTSIVFCFHVAEDIDLLISIVCLVLPPLGLWLSTKKCDKDILIAGVLTLLGWFPGAIYAYYKC